MKIYIAGKITGDPDYQVKFMIARRDLEKRGHIVISPAVLPEGLEAADYMQICTAMINVADAVAFLPDWWDSPGAQLEQSYAAYTGKNRLWPWGTEQSKDKDAIDPEIFIKLCEAGEFLRDTGAISAD